MRHVDVKEKRLRSHWYCRQQRKMFASEVVVEKGDEAEGCLLYVGGFILPDQNAAAQRVIGTAKAMADAGYQVVFLNFSPNCTEPCLKRYYNFYCFECPAAEWYAARIDIDRVQEVAKHIDGLVGIVAYNFPALSMSKLIRYCKVSNLKCLGDVTEWYSTMDVSIVKKLPKLVDTAWRMRVLHWRCDGLIVISDYLQEFYNGIPTLNVPPLVDILDEKWPKRKKAPSCCKHLIYAGSPSKAKEQLDLVCKAVLDLPNEIDVVLDIVGIEKDQYRQIYGSDVRQSGRVVFHGRLSHREVLEMISSSSYAIVIRPDNRVTRAGFPTKFTESVSCGTAVLANNNSCLEKYLINCQCGFLVDETKLSETLPLILAEDEPFIRRETFDYRNYSDLMRVFLDEIIG